MTISDDQARRFAAALRTEAARCADTERALAEVLGDAAAVADEELIELGQVGSAPQRRWALVVAGLTAAAVTLGAIVLVRQDPPPTLVGNPAPTIDTGATVDPDPDVVPPSTVDPGSDATSPSTNVSPTAPAPATSSIPSTTAAAAVAPALNNNGSELVIAGASGVWSQGVGGSLRHQSEAMSFAIRLPDGRILTQRRSGYGEWPTMDAAPLVFDPLAFEHPVTELWPGRTWDGWVRVHDVNVVDGRTIVLYEVQRQPDPFGPDAGALVAEDLASGEVTALGEVGGWEQHTSRLHLAANGWIIGVASGLVYHRLFALSIGADPPPNPQDFGLEPSYSECNECPRAFTVSHDGTLFGWLEGDNLVVALRSNRTVIRRTPLGAAADDLSIDIELEDDRAVLNRFSYLTFMPSAPLLVITAADSAVSELTGAVATLSPVPPQAPDAAAIEALVRPSINLEGCTSPSGTSVDARVGLFIHIQPSVHPVQLIADPVRGIAAPYAIVERHVDDVHTAGTARPVRVFVGPYGQGEVNLLLDDGSELYVRARGFDAEQLAELAEGLMPRDAKHPVPGFDFRTPSGSALQLVDETNDLRGTFTSLQCVLANGANLGLAVLDGSPVFQYAVALDWIPLPVVAEAGRRVISVIGPSREAHAAMNSLVESEPIGSDSTVPSTTAVG